MEHGRNFETAMIQEYQDAARLYQEPIALQNQRLNGTQRGMESVPAYSGRETEWNATKSDFYHIFMTPHQDITTSLLSGT
jgi:hypothetical protein